MGSNYSVPEHHRLHFNDDEIDKLRRTYKILSKRYDGKVLSNGVFCTHFNQKLKDEYFSERLFAAFNTSRSGFIDIDEFSRGISTCLRGRGAPSLEFLFDFFNIKRTGTNTITLEEIRTVFQRSAFCGQVAASVSEEEARQLAATSGPLMAVAIHNFTGKTDKELSFVKGEYLKILKKLDTNWWWCESSTTNKRGYIPHSYVRELQPQDGPIARLMQSAARADADGDGKFTKPEFMLWASKQPEMRAILAQLAALDITPPDPFFLSAPRNFQHTAHLGLNPETGVMERRNIPPEWRQLFREAGITDDEIEDADTAQMLVDVVALQAPEVVTATTQTTSPAAASGALPAPPGGWIGSSEAKKNTVASAEMKFARKRRGRSRSENNVPDFTKIQQYMEAHQSVTGSHNKSVPESRASLTATPDGLLSPPPTPASQVSAAEMSPRDGEEYEEQQEAYYEEEEQDDSDSIPPPPPPEEEDAPPPPPPEEEDEEDDDEESESQREEAAGGGFAPPALPSFSFAPPPLDLSTLHSGDVDVAHISGERRPSIISALRKSIREHRAKSFSMMDQQMQQHDANAAALE